MLPIKTMTILSFLTTFKTLVDELLVVRDFVRFWNWCDRDQLPNVGEVSTVRKLCFVWGDFFHILVEFSSSSLYFWLLHRGQCCRWEKIPWILDSSFVPEHRADDVVDFSKHILQRLLTTVDIVFLSPERSNVRFSSILTLVVPVFFYFYMHFCIASWFVAPVVTILLMGVRISPGRSLWISPWEFLLDVPVFW